MLEDLHSVSLAPCCLWMNANLQISAILRNGSEDQSTMFAPSARLKGRVGIQDGNVDIRVPYWSSFDCYILQWFVEWGLIFLSPSNICACLVVAWSRRIYVTAATPLITCHTKADPLSEMIVLGKQACLVMIVFRTLSNFLAFQIRVRKANNFLKNSSIVLTMYS